MGIWKVRNSPYHVQTNGQVKQGHQMLMCMIVKLSKKGEADCLKHLPKLACIYNSMRSAITGYSPNNLMFGHQPHLPINFYFPTIKSIKKHQYVDHYITKLQEWLWEDLKEA